MHSAVASRSLPQNPIPFSLLRVQVPVAAAAKKQKELEAFGAELVAKHAAEVQLAYLHSDPRTESNEIFFYFFFIFFLPYSFFL